MLASGSANAPKSGGGNSGRQVVMTEHPVFASAMAGGMSVTVASEVEQWRVLGGIPLSTRPPTTRMLVGFPFPMIVLLTDAAMPRHLRSSTSVAPGRRLCRFLGARIYGGPQRTPRWPGVDQAIKVVRPLEPEGIEVASRHAVVVEIRGVHFDRTFANDGPICTHDSFDSRPPPSQSIVTEVSVPSFEAVYGDLFGHLLASLTKLQKRKY
jgi:hypothetical protein